MKRLLLISYAFPPRPYAGVHRPLRFVQYLPGFGWQPTVLTAAPSNRDRDDSLLEWIPPAVRIHSTCCVDPYSWTQRQIEAFRAAARGGAAPGIPPTAGAAHLGSNGAPAGLHGALRKLKDLLLGALSTPDRMVFWIPHAIAEGARILRRERFNAIVTTAPPHSSHLIGMHLARRFGVPWVADFRDPWMDNLSWHVAPRTRFRRAVESRLEGKVIRRADRILVVSNTYFDRLVDRHPTAAKKCLVLPNGFDPADFAEAAPSPPAGPFTFAYLGSLYLFQRAEPFLDGLRLWATEHRDLKDGGIRVLFAGKGTSEIAPHVAAMGLESVVEIRKLLPHREAIRLMTQSHALLLIIGFCGDSGGILTAKLFEYLASGRPILAVVPEGEAARVVREARAGCVVADPSPRAIADGIEAVRTIVQQGTFAPRQEFIARFDGRRLTGDLARILDEIAAPQRRSRVGGQSKLA